MCVRIFWYQLKSVVSGKVLDNWKPFEDFLGEIGDHVFLNGAGAEDEYEIVDYAEEITRLGW